jgi:hypothetical protein
MFWHMRTSIDIPDSLLRRAKALARRKGITMRALVVEGLCRVLDQKPTRVSRFRLEDCSVGEGGLVEGLAATDWDEIRRRAYEERGG